jgi:spore coat protein A, manganese oxidase
MERKDYQKLLLTAVILIFAVTNLLAQLSQDPPVTTVGTATFSAGTWSVPVTVSNFTNVGNISMVLNYDPLRLTYTGVTVNGGLSSTGLLVTPTTDQSGIFKLSYTQATPVVLVDPVGTLFTLTFTASPFVNGASVPLTWGTHQGECEITPPSPGVYVPEIDATNLSTYFISGSINVQAWPIVTGPATICSGSSGTAYSAIAGASGYSWIVSAGGHIISGNGTHSISVGWDVMGPQTVSVTYTDPVNGSVTGSLDVSVETLVASITGPLDPSTNLPATIGNGITVADYFTEPLMTNYVWNVSSAGQITSGAGTDKITVTWTNPPGLQSISVTYVDPDGCTPPAPAELLVQYFPFRAPIDPTIIPKYVDPLPHFAAGLRVNAKAGGSLLVKAALTQQVAVSTGTILANGTVGTTAGAGVGNYAGYGISTDGGATFGPVMWPAQTIETQVGNGLTVQYRNDLTNVTYDDFNILADQTLTQNGYPVNGNIYTDPYRGPVPMVTHLHGGEMPSNSDGGPTAWFMPGESLLGPGFQFNASSLATYPNQQEAGTLWYHPHDQGLTRINVYTGLAGFYFLRGDDEEAAHLPGWSGDNQVQEVTPAGKTTTFNGSKTYLPEIEVAIQDRMFDVNGQLYWPVAPTNPDLHPYWTPEFFGDLFTVNGKTWPYLSVAPRKYRFRFLDGCNARFLNMWLQNASTAAPGPAITVIGSDGAFKDTPAILDPASFQTLFMAPGERYDIVIDFTGVPSGTAFTLMNDAPAPYPTGDPVVPGLTDQIMQFIVNGNLIGADNSQVPANLRPAHPMVKLADFNNGTVAAGVTPAVKRQIILNEVTGAGGPVQVLFNNSHFDGATPIVGAPTDFGGPTETPREGTTELVQVINTTVDAHPIHIHLTQWQLVSRQAFDATGYMNAYSAAWTANGSYPEWPAGLGYPGGSGPPNPYDQLNGDGAVGGNPAVTPFLIGSPNPAPPEEAVWKDDVKSFPGEVVTFLVRYAPTDRPINATPQELMYPFDPFLGPGYVWHCHIIDHEDMDMMRPLMVQPSPERFPKVTVPPSVVIACAGDNTHQSVTATSDSPITYQWQSSSDGTSWADLPEAVPYSGTKTSTLTLSNVTLPLNNSLFRVLLDNIDGQTASNAGSLAVNNCTVSGMLKYANAATDPLSGYTVTINGVSSTTDATGAYSVSGVTSGSHEVTLDGHGKVVGAINSTDAGLANYWFANPTAIPHVKFMAGDVNNDIYITSADALRIQNYFVLGQAFDRAPWQFHSASGTTAVNPPAFTVTVDGTSVPNFDILSLVAGDFNASFRPNALAKRLELPKVKLAYDGLIKATAGKTFDLPIRIGSDLQVGAVSLILTFSSDLVDVAGVEMQGTKVPASYDYSNRELRIGWYALEPVSLKADASMLILKLRASTEFTDGESLLIDVTEDPLNELANGAFQPIETALLKSYRVEGMANTPEKPANMLEITVHPNPVIGVANLAYTLPGNGQVTIELYNMTGSVVSTILKDTRLGGKYTESKDLSSLPGGVYMAKIRFRGTGPEISQSARFIIMK